MVDLGIARTQDLQNPIQNNTAATRLSSEVHDKAAKGQDAKVSGRKGAEAVQASPQTKAVDVDLEVRRLNDLLGNSTRIQFVINRSNNDVYVEVVDKESNKVLKTIPPSDLNGVAGKLVEGGMLVDNRS